MAMMDEACLNVGNTTDKQLLDAMDSQLAQSKYYSSKKKDATKNKVDYNYISKHMTLSFMRCIHLLSSIAVLDRVDIYFVMNLEETQNRGSTSRS